ncbi:Hsp33 family molecular chaperone HslO [Geothrix sp. PMB-07]|uniref:Hsp33 family molecular chaperone HslO n=1 Tax=Geothrix sp. PMB-07 TaxID=3068640 RepID=UPI002740B1D5|nr:Hsp33 family molecular chaperone HslO [Geothrix sp. PMB-07]WLT31846.1 Hsp33 family molecular chaperone HslO [Geothrix sp. PMB-07]
MNESIRRARVIKALTKDRHIRLSSLDASPLWDGVRRGHPHLDPEACACLTELLAATALLQGRTVFEERLQLLVKGSGKARAVVADSWPDGTIRGVLDLGDPNTEDWIVAPGVLQVMRSNVAGQPYIGNLELVEGGIQTQVEHYLQNSEQIQASLSLWCDPGTGEAGGLLVEPLPDCPPLRLARLVQAIEGLDVVPFWERTPEFLANWVSQGEGTDELATVDLDYRCRCTREALLETLRGFSEAQKADLFQTEGPLEVRCDYCGTLYPITKADLLTGEA